MPASKPYLHEMPIIPPVKVSQIEWHGDWWVRVQHQKPRTSTFDIRAIQNQFIVREDADIWVEGQMNGSEFHMSYKRTDDPHEFASSWTGFTYVKQETQGEIPIILAGDAFAMVHSSKYLSSHDFHPLPRNAVGEVSKEQFECPRQALWTVQIGTVENYNTSFWKDVATNGFEKYLQSIDEYENHSARSVRFVHDMDPVGASSESEGEGLEPPTPNSLSDRVGREKPDPEDSEEEEEAPDPEIRVSTFFGRLEVDFIRKIELMLLEEHVPAGQRWDNVKSVLLGAYTRQGCGVSKHTKSKASLLPHLHQLAKTRPSAQLGTEEGAEEYTSIQLNKVSELMVHQDRFNQGCNWVISISVDVKGRHHPPGLPESPLRGQYYDTRYTWLKFNPKLKHAVEPVTGTRVSLVFFTPQRLSALSEEHWDTFIEFGFPCEQLRAMHAFSGSSCIFSDICLQQLELAAVTKTEDSEPVARKVAETIMWLRNSPYCSPVEDGRYIKRFMSDKGGEFESDIFAKSKSNGLAAAQQQQASVLGYEWDLPVFGELVAVWEMRPKDHYHSLDHRGALGRFLMINYFGDGETTLLTETGRILKLTPLDKNVYRLHHQWNKFPGSGSLRSRVFDPWFCPMGRTPGCV
eukprot:1564125-Amphidinium_carterae.1